MDQGPTTGTGELFLSTSGQAGVFLEIHNANNFSSAASSGVPGGISGPASASGSYGPGDFSGLPDVQAYGTVSNGNAVAPVFFQNYPINNPAGGSSAINLFKFKNPA